MGRWRKKGWKIKAMRRLKERLNEFKQRWRKQRSNEMKEKQRVIRQMFFGKRKHPEKPHMSQYVNNSHFYLMSQREVEGLR